MTRHYQMHSCKTLLFAVCLGILGTGTWANTHAQGTSTLATAAETSSEQTRIPSSTSSVQEPRPAVVEVDPCLHSAESTQCLKARIDQLAGQVSVLEARLKQQEQQPPVPANLNLRVSNTERDVKRLYAYLKLGKADGVDDIWSEIGRIEKRLGMR